MTKRVFVYAAGLFLFLTVGVNPAHSATVGAEIQHFHSVADGQGIVVTESARTLDLWKPAFGLMFNYGHRPLVLCQVDTSTNQCVESQDIVKSQFAMDVNAAIGFRYASLGVSFPLNLYIGGDDTLDGGVTPVKGTTPGDLRLIPKIRIVDPMAKKFGVAIVVPIALPTGATDKYSGDASVRIIPQAVLGYQGERFRTFVNLGAQIRPGGESVAQSRQLLDLNVGTEFVFSWGMGIRAHRVLEINTELWGGIGGKSNTSPVEWALGVNIQPRPIVNINVGIGTAMGSGYGAPVFRAYFGAGIALQRNDDKDYDGIVDAEDECPTEAEDKDGFEDADGCPELDNDKDGIVDKDDECPNEPETLNGFDDEDGCADEGEDSVVDTPDETDLSSDEDTDGDGVADADDGCPSDPEDPDDFEDEDGCPDYDNDNDEIPDGLDDCPLEAEVWNAFEDNDGCPDEGLVVIERSEGKIAKIAILEKVFFEVDKAVIKGESYPVLDAVYNVLRTYDEIRKVEIQGHTDSDGKDADNMTLSQERAEAVMMYLVDKGVAGNRLTAKGYGETLPIDSNKTDEGKANNRRVEFIVLEQD